MATPSRPPPKPARELIDTYFIENRTRLLDIAAFLDRLDRADASVADFRMDAFREALQVLCDGSYPRTERIQMVLSDPTTEPLEQPDRKSARGAYGHRKEVR